MTIKTAQKVFYKEEISSVENFYLFRDKKKLTVFVPENFIEKITKELSRAGAGCIGNYSMCSFRTKGVGTFLPGKNAIPFSGRNNKMSFENEVKLEMECNDCDLNNIIDALLKYHPYEEAVYEIYSFMKRADEPSGFFFKLNKRLSYSELFKRLNRKIEFNNITGKDYFKKIVITENEVTENIINSAKLTGSDCLLLISKKINKLFKL